MIKIARGGITRVVKATELPYWKAKGYAVVEEKQEQPVIVAEDAAETGEVIAETETEPEEETKASKKAPKKRK